MVDCPTCGKECATENGMKNHHAKIHGESLSVQEYECFICGDTFERHKSQMENQERYFCSNDCRGEWQSNNWKGENHHLYQGGKVGVECTRCGFEFRVYPSYAKRKYGWDGEGECKISHFCINCVNDTDYMDNVPFGKNWKEQRAKARNRDNNECVKCGMDNEKHKELFNCSLNVHHRVPRREFIKDGQLDYEEANRLENLVTLCAVHHKKAECGDLAKEL